MFQEDIRELQLAKGAIAAGMGILLSHWGGSVEQLERIFLAGAFGNYMNHLSARRIGLLEANPHKVVAVGNTALRGAKMVLLAPSRTGRQLREARRRIHHLSLAADPRFQDEFAACMNFPAAG